MFDQNTEPESSNGLPSFNEAKALKQIFEVKAKELGVSQREFGSIAGIGSQSLVWQYLNGRTPLNLAVAVKFAQGLGVQVKDFSPRLAKELQEIVDAARQLDDASKDGARSRVSWVSLPVLPIDASGVCKTSYTPPMAFTEHIKVSKQWAEHHLGTDLVNYYVFVAQDGAMQPTINRGDLAFVDGSVSDINGDGIYLFKHNGLMLLRRVYALLEGGQYCLKADADKYQSEILTKQQALELKVIGKVQGYWSIQMF